MTNIILVVLVVTLSYLYGYHQGKRFMKVVMGNYITHRRLEALADLQLRVDSHFFTVLDSVEQKIKEM